MRGSGGGDYKLKISAMLRVTRQCGHAPSRRKLPFLLSLACRLEDQFRDGVGLRYQGKVARLHFDGFRAHALGHEALEIRIDRPVLRRDGIETGLGAPGRMRRLAREQRLVKWLLDRVEHLRFRFRQVACEIVQERSLAETSFIA